MSGGGHLFSIALLDPVTGQKVDIRDSKAAHGILDRYVGVSIRERPFSAYKS